MSSPARQRPSSPGISAEDASSSEHGRAARRAARKAAQEAAVKAAAAQRTAAHVISAEEIQAKVRAEAARKATRPPWYQRKRYAVPAFAAFLAVVSGVTYVGTRPAPPPPPVVHVAPTLAAPSIGETVTDGRFAFTLRSVTYQGDEVGAAVGAEKARDEWIVVHVDVTNATEVAGPLDVWSQALVDTAGNTYPASTVPSLDGWEQAYVTGIEPGETVAALMPFDVPEDTPLDHLEVTDAQFGEGATIPLR